MLGKKWRALLDACLMYDQLLMLIRWPQHSPGGALEGRRDSGTSVHRVVWQLPVAVRRRSPVQASAQSPLEVVGLELEAQAENIPPTVFQWYP